MARRRTTSLTITLTPEERRTLLAWQRSTTIRAGLCRRTQVILLVAEGRSITAIAAMVGISRRFVYRWAQRFLAQGVEGLADKPGRGYGRVPRRDSYANLPRASRGVSPGGAGLRVRLYEEREREQGMGW